MRSAAIRVLALMGAVVFSSCGGGASSLRPQAIGWTTIEWQPCPPDAPGAPEADCALVEVPLDGSAPGSEPITILTRRIRPSGASRGQLWALDGGPGEPGDGFFDSFFASAVVDAGFELLVPSHRGGAYSTPLQCPGASGREACIAALQARWGSGLRHFDAHAAARDVVALARAHASESGGPVLLFGGSYGSVWAQRVLQAEPELFDGVYIDSVGDLAMNFERVGEWVDGAGRRALERCAATPECARHFSDGPVAAADRVQAAARAGTGCFAGPGVSLTEVQRTLASWLGGTDDRALIAPLIHRLDRCEASDRAVLSSVFGTPATPLRPSSTFNPLLNLTATYRALYRATVERPELEALAETLLFDSGAMLAHADTRPLYPDDFARAVDVEGLDYAGPLHIVQGALDPLTPLALADDVAARWPAASLDRVTLPEGGHASPRYTVRGDGERCSERWLVGFVHDPAQPFDVACMDDVAPVDWGATETTTLDHAEVVFGTRDVWGP